MDSSTIEKKPFYSSDVPGSPDEDLEKRHGSYQASDGAVPGHTFEYGNGWYAKTMRFAGKLNIEQRGIERVPEDERHEFGLRGLLNVMTMVRSI